MNFSVFTPFARFFLSSGWSAVHSGFTSPYSFLTSCMVLKSLNASSLPLLLIILISTPWTRLSVFRSLRARSALSSSISSYMAFRTGLAMNLLALSFSSRRSCSLLRSSHEMEAVTPTTIMPIMSTSILAWTLFLMYSNIGGAV